jgi:hypothetical protein
MNTKLVVALFVGAISAKQLPNINMLTVQTSDEGVKQLEAQGQKNEAAWKAAASTKQFADAHSAGEAWSKTNEAQGFFGLLEHASHSAEAQRLDGHAQALHNSVSPVKNGAHINNDVLEARLDAIEAEINHIEKDTSFPRDAELAWKKATSTSQAQHFGHSLESWGKTA